MKTVSRLYAVLLMLPTLAWPQKGARAQSPSPKATETAAPRLVAITADVVGREATRTSFSLRAQQQAIQAAAARVDQAWANFLPQLSLTARYTRLSNVTNPPIALGGGGPGTVLSTRDKPGTVNPTIEVSEAPVVAPLTFPVILDNFVLQAQIAVPISDYFFRINQGYSAATQAAEAAKQDAATAAATAYTEGKLAYYNHLRARGALIVAEQAVLDVKQRVADVRAQESVGNASRADSLRAETGLSAATLQVERIKNLVRLTEKQVRIAMHVPDATVLQLDERLEDGLPIAQGTPGAASLAANPAASQASSQAPNPPDPKAHAALLAEALATRPELKSIDANLAALKAQSKAAFVGMYPSVSLFGDAQLANPNQRIFPQSPKFSGTWAAGIQATWSPNEIFRSGPSSKEVDQRVLQVESQREQLRDGIDLELTQATQSVSEASLAIASNEKGKESAEEALRVARELFKAGRATATLITDAETEVAKARLESLNAHVDLRIARVRLEHALGRDVTKASGR
jgi:outer membrane protein TolC